MPRDQMGVIPEMEGWFNTQKKIDAQNMPCRQAEGEKSHSRTYQCREGIRHNSTFICDETSLNTGSVWGAEMSSV